MRGRQLGKRLVCALCNAKRYLNGGRVRELTAPVAYAAYPNPNRIVWLVAGDAVCTNHVQCRPQPPRPVEITKVKTCRCGRTIPSDRTICPECKAVGDAEKRALRFAARILVGVKRSVLERDGMVCRHCGRAVHFYRERRGPDDRLSYDHFPIPASKGGLGTADNVVISCIRCNKTRANRSSETAHG